MAPSTTETALRRVQDWLQGKPLGHPLHPALVHLPIGLFTLSLLFDAATWLVEPANWLVRAAFYSLAFGVAAALAAAATGLADWADIRTDHPAKKTATTHMLLNLAVVVLFAVSAVFRLFVMEAARTPWPLVLLSLAAMGLLGYSGYLGGKLVYGDGIGVGRHRRPGATPDATLKPAAGRAQDGFTPVAYTSRLRHGETLRAEVNGYVLTIANLDGEYYAFQEFCTHRFGPLSEGDLREGQVECPWHRSCFDVRTGAVTHGPAKVPLRTFDVRVDDDVIHVRVPVQAPQPVRVPAEEQAE